jgi:hypothetical protein
MKDNISGGTEKRLTTLTCLQNVTGKDDLVRQIEADLVGKSSILETMKGYMDSLRGELDNDALPFRKLHRLFELGSTPDRMEGHYYGVAIGLRSGNLRGVVAEYGNLLGFLWGMAIGGVAPWVGKSFALMDPTDRRQVAGATIPENVSTYRGINHFNLIQHAPVNLALTTVLTFMWHLKDAPETENRKYGHERNGGHFAAYRAFSIYDRTPKDVFRLNYRFTALENSPPLTFLIDEVVEIADGLYLGQVLFSTDRLLERYDPMAKSEIYRYQHFGYFLLFSEAWNGEAKRLFPHLEVPERAVPAGTPHRPYPGGELLPGEPDKFKTLTLADPPTGDVDPDVMAEIREDLSRSENIMGLLKSYSDTLGEDPDTRSPVFGKLHALFNAGIGPKTMSGFYRGARITFQSQGLLAAFNVNTLNIAWGAARFLTPWTGKGFDPIDQVRLSALTDGYERMNVPTFFGSNTVAFRTYGQKLIRKVMKLIGGWMEDATNEERLRYGYDARCFFFIGKPARSIVPENKGKEVFQFNYRWKALRTLPPDNFCIDEIVQIAQGLYLGKLIYATELLLPWDPETDSSAYKYRLFGYFLLMDEDWHARRLRIGFDLDDV